MKKLLLPAAVVICAVAAIIMVIMLVTSGSGKSFTPPPFDPAAQTGTPESAGYGDLDAGDFKFYAVGNLTAENGKTDIWLTNPAENNIWLKARLLDKDENILGESGLIKPGEYIQSIELDEIPKGTSSITLKIMAYAPDTYQSAGAIALNTDLKAE